MQSHWPRLAALSIAVLSVFAFLLGGDYAADRLIDSQRTKQLVELGNVALRRLENTVDYGALAIDDTSSRGLATCEAAALQSIRLHVYQRTSVKDIRILDRDGMVQCSAYSETLEFDKGWTSRDDMLPAVDPSLRLFRVEQFFGVALGVMRDVEPGVSLAAIIGINSSLFDIMPAELRDHSEVALELSNGGQIGRSSPSDKLDEESGGVFATIESSRFPVRARIRVTNEAFERWNHEPYYPIMFIAGLLGLAFGAMLARLLIRDDGPVGMIDRAIAAHEFRPYMQPVFKLGTGEVVGCEVLARWIKPDGTLIPPARFLQLIEDNGRIEAFTWHLLSVALGELRETMAQNKTFKLSINIAPDHFLADNFIDELRRVVLAAKASPRQIVLEITERDELSDLVRAAATVTKLRDLGFRVALDDVGIGHSGLSYIQKLGAHVLKIDKFFVDSISRDASAIAVVGMLVRLARELDMEVVAEGIEDETQMAALAGCGIEQGQGYLVSPAIPARDFVAFARSRPRIEPARPRSHLAAVA